jgi:hypothetical protein
MVRNFLLRLQQVISGSSSMDYLSILHEDITERKQAEEAPCKEKEWLAVALQYHW